ncbi:MAG: MBL fold metallo-hydrolase [Proteobacteria bacterium]|nr:MBL fold metallo-hydrolase [Desulfobulbaceae bacterium]MBU4152706.1 MBL fold metallo-hydrolase [Pseudomonadota bacterium]
MKSLQVGTYEIFWLNGGAFELDGGTMFGPVPKIIWSKRYPVDQENYIRLVATPLLIKGPGVTILIESGIGNKLTDKQRKIFRIQQEWDLPAELSSLGIDRQDIDTVILTHGDWDHASGIVMHNQEEKPELTFANARHYLQRSEWDDIRRPNTRAASSYWPHNFDLLAESDNLILVDDEVIVAPGITLCRTGGHTRGHQAIKIDSEGQRAIHMGDLMPTHAHLNPLWVMAYDNYPLEVIDRKRELTKWAVNAEAWVLFYHNPFLSACCFSPEGTITKQWPPAADT